MVVRDDSFSWSRSLARRRQASSLIRFGAITEFDAKQRDAAQDERCDGARQVHALRQPAGRDRAAIGGRGQHVGERMAADHIDAACPALFLAERLGRS